MEGLLCGGRTVSGCEGLRGEASVPGKAWTAVELRAHRPGGRRTWLLPPDEVHVWQVGLVVTAAHAARLYDTLSPDERVRAARYHFLRDRDRFVAARGWLRTILGLYVGCQPRHVRLRYNRHGKPELDGIAPSAGGTEEDASARSAGSTSLHRAASPDDLQFNLSHSEDLALCAVARGRRVGIDVEAIRPGFADDGLPETFFSPQEVEALRALAPDEQPAAFFTCWTRKEAYLKARGEGLIIPLDSFAVLPAPPDRSLATPAEADDLARWSLCDLDLGPGYAAALAGEGHGWRLRLWRLANSE